MRRPSKRLIIIFLISLALGFASSWAIMVFVLGSSLRLYGFGNLSAIALLITFLLIIFLDGPLNLRAFDWPTPDKVKKEAYPKGTIWDWFITVDHKKNWPYVYHHRFGVFYRRRH